MATTGTFYVERALSFLNYTVLSKPTSTSSASTSTAVESSGVEGGGEGKKHITFAFDSSIL